MTRTAKTRQQRRVLSAREILAMIRRAAPGACELLRAGKRMQLFRNPQVRFR